MTTTSVQRGDSPNQAQLDDIARRLNALRTELVDALGGPPRSLASLHAFDVAPEIYHAFPGKSARTADFVCRSIAQGHRHFADIVISCGHGKDCPDLHPEQEAVS